MSVTKIGLRAPVDYSDSAKSLHFAQGDDTMADVTACTDGIGYIVETWNIGDGLTAFWRADTFTEAAEFADKAVES